MFKPTKPTPVGTPLYRERKVLTYRNLDGKSLQDILDASFPNMSLGQIRMSLRDSPYPGESTALILSRYEPKTQEEYDYEMVKYNSALATWATKEKGKLEKKKQDLLASLQEVEEELSLTFCNEETDDAS